MIAICDLAGLDKGRLSRDVCFCSIGCRDMPVGCFVLLCSMLKTESESRTRKVLRASNVCLFQKVPRDQGVELVTLVMPLNGSVSISYIVIQHRFLS